MARATSNRLSSLDIAMVFAFVFDQFWTLLQAPKLERFITEFVGAAYQTTPRFWANYVSPTAGGAGFLPHVDGGDDHPVTYASFAPGHQA